MYCIICAVSQFLGVHTCTRRFSVNASIIKQKCAPLRCALVVAPIGYRTFAVNVPCYTNAVDRESCVSRTSLRIGA